MRRLIGLALGAWVLATHPPVPPVAPSDSPAGTPADAPRTVSQTRPTTLTSLWRDAPDDPALVRLDPVTGVSEPSDLLWRAGALYTIGDSYQAIYELSIGAGSEGVKVVSATEPAGIPERTDLEALAGMPGGEVLLASETNGTVFVLSPFPSHICAAWRTGVPGTCLIGRPNCGIEAMAVLPDGRLFVAKEREPRAAYLFDLPATPCAASTLTGRTPLKLPDETGPDISAATWDARSGHLLVVARSNQKVLEFDLLEPAAGSGAAASLALVGSFSYSATEDRIGYGGPFPAVEGIAVDEARVLYLILDNNEERSRMWGDRRATLLRFLPAR